MCRVGEVESARHKKTLYYIKEVLWQVESEFACDSRQALIDFNKLVLGSAQNKLFIGPKVSDTATTAFINVLRPAAQVCMGNVFVALVPHPREWGKDTGPIQIWKFDTL